MEDLDDLLLEAAGRRTGTTGRKNQSKVQGKRRREGSYSDDPSDSGSGSEDDDSDDPGFTSRKPSGSQVPLKKRFDVAEKDDERSARDDINLDDEDDDDIRQSDSGSSFAGSDLYKDDDDREELSKMTELQREMILADRAESRDNLLKKKAGAWHSDNKNRVGKESVPSSSARAHSIKPGKTVYKDALVELAARRKAQDAGYQRKTRDLAGRHSPKRRGPFTDSPPGGGGDSSSSSDSSGSDDSRGSLGMFSKRDTATVGVDLGESDEDAETSGADSATYEDIKEITVRRSKLLKWFMEPFFEDAIVGCYVRVGIGMTPTGRSMYRLCVVRNVDASDSDRTYKFENRTTHKYLNCVWGNETAAARWQMARVSDSPPLEEEYTALVREIERNGGRIPSKQDILEKRDALKKINSFVYSAATVKQMLQEKKSALARPSNIAAEKDRLRKDMDVAESRGEYEEIAKVKARLQELEALSRQSKDSNSKAMKLAEMNKRNKEDNFKNASELKPKNTTLKAGEAGYDPFSRRWTRSRNYYVSKPAEEEEVKTAKAAVITDTMRASEEAKTAAALEAAAGSGKLVDTSAPVGRGTESYSLHDFELPISLAALQKFSGPQVIFMALMARKQRVEATVGVKVPENDGRRHALTLTVSDYKRRRGLL